MIKPSHVIYDFTQTFLFWLQMHLLIVNVTVTHNAYTKYTHIMDIHEFLSIFALTILLFQKYSGIIH